MNGAWDLRRSCATDRLIATPQRSRGWRGNPTIPWEKLIFWLVPAQFFKFGPLALDLQLISLDLLILLYGLVVPPLELIADERSGAQTEQPSDGSAGARMTYGGTNDSTGCGAAKSTDARALLTSRESASRAPCHQRARQ